MDSLGSGRMSSSQREDLMDQVKQQIVIANTQELLTVRTEGVYWVRESGVVCIGRAKVA